MQAATHQGEAADSAGGALDTVAVADAPAQLALQPRLSAAAAQKRFGCLLDRQGKPRRMRHQRLVWTRTAYRQVAAAGRRLTTTLHFLPLPHFLTAQGLTGVGTTHEALMQVGLPFCSQM